MTPSIPVISSSKCPVWSEILCFVIFVLSVMICSFSYCKSLSCDVACCIPLISLSLFSLWFCLESHSARMRSELDLYIIETLYWCILRRICFSLCDSIATSFFKYCHQWLVICDYTYLSCKVVMMEFLRLCSIPNASLPMLLYPFLCLIDSYLQM